MATLQLGHGSGAAIGLARFALLPILGPQAPLLPFVLAIFVGTYLGGLGRGCLPARSAQCWRRSFSRPGRLALMRESGLAMLHSFSESVCW